MYYTLRTRTYQRFLKRRTPNAGDTHYKRFYFIFVLISIIHYALYAGRMKTINYLDGVSVCRCAPNVNREREKIRQKRKINENYQEI